MAQKKLQAWVRFALRYLFDEDELDPVNAPMLAANLERLKQNFHNYAEAPDGLEKTFNETVAELREAFASQNPKLRTRYASVIAPQQAEKEH